KNGLVVNITPKRGLHVYFQKKASGFNQCIGDALRHKAGGSRESVRNSFSAAASSCAGRRGKKKATAA
ncbi:MAG: hypothetical protein Q8K02_00405, partial [Flavobacterium sp.]|nr:hypothetical protein [Flavobacterium sp.]